MTVPVINAVINFSTGPSFAQAMIFDTGIFGTNVFADSAAVIVDVSNQVNRIIIFLSDKTTHILNMEETTLHIY